MASGPDGSEGRYPVTMEIPFEGLRKEFHLLEIETLRSFPLVRYSDEYPSNTMNLYVAQASRRESMCFVVETGLNQSWDLATSELCEILISKLRL